MQFTKICVAVVCFAGVVAMVADAAEKGSVLDHKVKSLTGKEVDLKQYEGKVVLFVNVASQCGYTPQYKDLQALHEKYKDKGLVVLGFPCNQFGAQEPGTSADIQSFCEKNYGVTFDLFEKADVNGPKQSPVYKDLTTKSSPAGDVKWNFEKFLVGKDGSIVGRYKSGVKPMGEELTTAIDAAIAK